MPCFCNEMESHDVALCSTSQEGPWDLVHSGRSACTCYLQDLVSTRLEMPQISHGVVTDIIDYSIL